MKQMHYLGIVASVAIVPLIGQTPTLSPAPRALNAGTAMRSDVTRAVSIMGKVEIAGGGTLDQPVRIERVCNGVSAAAGFTDVKGNFSITLGQEQAAMPDASEAATRGTLNPSAGRAMSAAQISGCELRASVPGYRSDVVSLANRRTLDNPNVGTIFLHRAANVDGLTVSASTALAPKDARKAYEKGLDAAHRNKPDEAQKEFQKAVDVYPRFAAAWFALGKIYEQRDHTDKARDAYTQSIGADSKYLYPYERLYIIAYRAGNWQDAADVSDRLLRLDPVDFPEAYYYNAVANLKLERLDAAEKSAREAVKLDTAHRDAKANYTLGYILAQKGVYEEAAQYMRAYLQMEPNGPQSDQVRKQLGDIESAARAQAHEH